MFAFTAFLSKNTVFLLCLPLQGTGVIHVLFLVRLGQSPLKQAIFTTSFHAQVT